jgi:hypothetical protein
MRMRWKNSRWYSRGRCCEEGLTFIEGRETEDKVVKFGGMGIADKEIVVFTKSILLPIQNWV